MATVPSAYYQFIMDYAPYVYVIPGSGPDPEWGKAAFAAAFAIDFLYEAYHDSQFAGKQTDIYNKIVSLADWLLTQQCTDPTRKAYGGFKSGESSSQYWSIDAGRVIPALLKAYALTSTSTHLDAAKLAGNTFLYNMQYRDEPYIGNFFIESEGTLLEGFETLGEWTVGGTGASQEADTSHFMEGTQSLKLNAANGNVAHSTKAVNFDLSTATNFILWIYVHNLPDLSQIALYFSSVTDWSKYFSVGVDVSCLKSGWNRVVLAKSQFYPIGGELWTNIMVQLRVRCVANSGVDASVSFDDLRHTHQARPKCIICLDDGYESAITKVKPILDANGQAAAAFIITNKVGTGGRMSVAQLAALHDAGWDICNHTKDHLDLTTLSEAEIETQVNDAYNWLVNNGFGDSAITFAYPYGAYNDTVLTKVKVNHKLARGIIADSFQPNLSEGKLGYDIEYLLKIMNVQNTTPVADVQARIDTAIEQKGMVILLFHQIVDSGASEPTHISPRTFKP